MQERSQEAKAVDFGPDAPPQSPFGGIFQSAAPVKAIGSSGSECGINCRKRKYARLTNDLVDVTLASSADASEAIDARRKHFFSRSFPPVPRRKDLHLLRAAIAGRFDGAADSLEVYDTVSHHPAVE